jgi:uncharacterized protein involved in response to NO
MNNAPKSTRPKNLLSIQENQARKERPMTGFGLWRLGFRPFYLGAAAFSALAITLWLATLFGLLGTTPLIAPSVNPLVWHAHEMVFGFALAVIAGFLLTASNNWTGILPAAGMPLALVFLCWALARWFMLLGDVAVASALDMAFVGLLSALLFRVLWLAKLWKNFFILGLVMLMGGLNARFYTILLSDLPANPLYPIELVLLVILQLLVVMGGRVIPMFTQNGVPGIRVWKPQALVWLTPLATALGIIGWLTLPPRLACLLCVVASLVNLVRWIGWKPWQSFKQPMVWVLQLGYLWIPVTLFTLSLEALEVVPRSLPIHALAVGAMGLIISGMITRTAMGHTGRPILASMIERVMFVLIAISGVLRTLAAIPVLQTPTLTPTLLLLSGGAWILAFLFYLSRYSPWLFRPRLDGRPG